MDGVYSILLPGQFHHSYIYPIYMVEKEKKKTLSNSRATSGTQVPTLARDFITSFLILCTIKAGGVKENGKKKDEKTNLAPLPGIRVSYKITKCGSMLGTTHLHLYNCNWKGRKMETTTYMEFPGAPWLSVTI